MQLIPDTALARVETEKRMALIKAWEESEKTKADNKYARMFIFLFSSFPIFWCIKLLVLYFFNWVSRPAYPRLDEFYSFFSGGPNDFSLAAEQRNNTATNFTV